MHRQFLRVWYLIISLCFSWGTWASKDFPTKLNNFKAELAVIQPTLQDSIVMLAGENYKFYVAGRGVTTSSQFYVGSVTKHITAFMLLKALQQKYPKMQLKFLLQQKLNYIFYDSKVLKRIAKPWSAKLTLLQLLTHRTGLSNYIEIYEHNNQATKLNKPISAHEILQNITFNRAKPYRYANSNYFLLGKLLEEITGQTYEEIFNEMVKGPAHMHNSYAPIIGNYYTFKQDRKFKNLQKNLNTKIFIDFANVGGAGGIIAAAEDLINWQEYLHKKTSQSIRDIMLDTYFMDADNDAINLGLTTTYTSLGKLIGFQGGLDSYKSFLGYIPKYKLNIVVLSNNNKNFEQIMNLVKEKLLSQGEE